jgi:Lrp/AsnC family leucine-responsive transcriptional regulator
MPSYELDDVDRRILGLLDEDARMSVRGLARAVGMSPGAIGERLDRLRVNKVIRGFRLDIDPAALGMGLEVLIGLSLKQLRPISETIKRLMDIQEVARVQLVTGQWDLILVLRVGDQHHLRDVLVSEIWALQDFRRCETMIILESHEGQALMSKQNGP